VDLYVQPPEEDGGMPVTHYIVGYENDSVDFIFGLFGLMNLLFCGIQCLLGLYRDVLECHNYSCCLFACIFNLL